MQQTQVFASRPAGGETIPLALQPRPTDRWWMALFVAALLAGIAAARWPQAERRPAAVPSLFDGWTLTEPLSIPSGPKPSGINAVDLPLLKSADPGVFNPAVLQSIIHLLQNSPSDPRGWILLGRILELDGKKAASESAYRRGLSLRKKTRVTLLGSLYQTALLCALYRCDRPHIAEEFFGELGRPGYAVSVSNSIVDALGAEDPELVKSLLEQWQGRFQGNVAPSRRLFDYLRDDLERYQQATQWAIQAFRVKPTALWRPVFIASVNALLQRGRVDEAQESVKGIPLRPNELVNLGRLVRVRDHGVAGLSALDRPHADEALHRLLMFTELEAGNLPAAKLRFQILLQHAELHRYVVDPPLQPLAIELMAKMPGLSLLMYPQTNEDWTFWEDVAGALSTPQGVFWMNRLLASVAQLIPGRGRIHVVRSLWYARRNLPQMAQKELAAALSLGVIFPRRIAVEVLSRGLWSSDPGVHQTTERFVRGLDWHVPPYGVSDLEYLHALVVGDEVRATAVATALFERNALSFWGLAAARGCAINGKTAAARGWEAALKNTARLSTKGLWVLEELKRILKD